MTYIFSHPLPQSVPDTPGMPNHTQPRLYRLLVWIIQEVHEYVLGIIITHVDHHFFKILSKVLLE